MSHVTSDLTSKIPVNNLKNNEFKTTFNSHLSNKTNHCILSIFPGIKISRIICRPSDLFMYLHNLHVHVYIHIIYTNLKVLNFSNLHVHVLQKTSFLFVESNVHQIQVIHMMEMILLELKGTH